MISSTSFKELKKHGSTGYSFEKYDIVSDRSRQFATSHWHDETEIVYVKMGAISITVNHKESIGKPGDIFIINSGEMHEIYGSSAPLQYSAFVFDFGMLSFYKDDVVQQSLIEPMLKGQTQFRNSVKPSEKAFALLEYINEINTSKPACFMLDTKAILLHFFALLIEENQIILSEKSSSNSEKRQILRDVIAYIHMNYAEKISLSDIAGQFHMSHKYFCRFFKNRFNKTFIEYLNDVRIENAVSLLNEKNISVTEAAISCGFCNMSYFTHTFKKKMGCTPSQYKKQSGL